MRDKITFARLLRALGPAFVVAGSTAVAQGVAPEPARVPAPPTYAGEVAAILQKHCLECHRPGQIGPFTLASYDQARKRADDIAAVVGDRRMPPWKAAPQAEPRFRHDRSISEADIAILRGWAEAGAPAGELAVAPPAPKYSGEWKLGTPDLVLEMAEDFTIPASGDDVYRCFVIPTRLGEDRYVSAVEYRAGNRRVVHHMLSYADTTAQGRKLDEADEGPGYKCFSRSEIESNGDLGGWAPGMEPDFFPEGVGRAIPRGSDIILQIHYHPSGKPEIDRSRIGLYFGKKPVKQTLHWAWIYNTDLEIPADDPRFKAEASWSVPVDIEARSITPHMHQIGRDMRIWATLPDGRDVALVRVEDWDFNWQITYDFEGPVKLPKGSVVKIVAHFDNSASNPRNPNKPPKPIKWGQGSNDEMCTGIMAVTKAGQDLTRPGEVDDLRQIFEKSDEERRQKLRERIAKERKEKPATD
jgi:mono/diheme cytochrome c family protein